MSQKDIYRAEAESQLKSSFERGFSRLSPSEALSVWNSADKTEKETLTPAFMGIMYHLDPERDSDLLDRYQKALE